MVTHRLWPPTSPYLNLCDYYFQVAQKDRVIHISHTLENLKDNTETKIGKKRALGGARPT